MVTDILLASNDEASAIRDQYPQRDAWPRLQLKGLDNAKLAALLEALDAPTEAAQLEGEACLAASLPDGPWVFLLPVALRDKLAALRESEFGGVADRWAAHEELTIDGWSAAAIEPGVAMLATHAKKAVEAGKDLVLWMAL